MRCARRPDSRRGTALALDPTTPNQVLSDAGKKQRYDAYGHGGVGGQAGGGFGGGGGNPFGAGGFAGFGFGGGQSAEDIFAQFDQMFSEAGRRQRAPRGPPRGQDVQAQVSLDFLQAVSGCKTTDPDPDPHPNPATLNLTLTLTRTVTRTRARIMTRARARARALLLTLTLALSLCLRR